VTDVKLAEEVLELKFRPVTADHEAHAALAADALAISRNHKILTYLID
jgi:hypothetical protein